MTLADTALDEQLRILHLFRSKGGEALAQHLLGRHDFTPLREGVSIAEMFYDNIGMAPTYAITPEMMAVVGQGHAQLCLAKETHPLDMTWLPSPSGFCWLGTPFPLEMASPAFESGAGLDPNQPKRPISALFWATQAVAFVNPLTQSQEIGSGVLMGVVVPSGDAFEKGADLTGFPYHHVPFDVTAWASGITWKVGTWAEYTESQRTKITGVTTWSGASWRFLMMVIWSLMNDRVSIVASHRNVRRRGERELGISIPPNYGDVKVVTLRRLGSPSVGGEPSEEDFHYSHRFLVSGHWRMQPYGPRAEQKRRLTWIRPFIKGPEDGPLIIKDTVNVLKR